MKGLQIDTVGFSQLKDQCKRTRRHRSPCAHILHEAFAARDANKLVHVKVSGLAIQRIPVDRPLGLMRD